MYVTITPCRHVTLISEDFEDSEEVMCQITIVNARWSPCVHIVNSKCKSALSPHPKLLYNGVVQSRPQPDRKSVARHEMCGLLMESIQSDRAWGVLPRRMSKNIRILMCNADRDISQKILLSVITASGRSTNYWPGANTNTLLFMINVFCTFKCYTCCISYVGKMSIRLIQEVNL